MAKNAETCGGVHRAGQGIDAGCAGRPVDRQAAGGAAPHDQGDRKGEYDGGMRLALMAAATAYIVSPIDVIPEAFFFVFGLADDAVMVTWLAGTVLGETERFLEWEKEPRSTSS